MKSFSPVLLLIVLSLILVLPCAQAQDYVVTTRRDTIRGEVKPLPFAMEKKVQVITSDKKKTVLSITQTLGYSLNGEIFQSVRYDKTYLFMKLVKSGYLSLYNFQMPNQTTYDGLFLVKRDGTSLEVPNIGFKKSISKYLQDCDAVTQGLEKGDLVKREIEKIVDIYNDCIEMHTAKNSKAIAVNVEAAKKITTWDTLEKNIQSEGEFEGKKDAVDMIAEIKGKITRSEKIPNFMLEGLKSILASKPTLKNELDEIIVKMN